MKRAVTKSAEILRILALEKRDWEKLDLAELTSRLTSYLKTPNGTMNLRHIQAVGLKEAFENGGLLGSVAVGFGKSLITYLAPVLMEAKRPLLLIPAMLKGKTERELVYYGEHFRIPSTLKVMSYELLSRDRGQKELLEYQPDMILSDECHKLKNSKAACTKRIGRYLKDHPETSVIAVSGTITRKSLMDYWHLLKWCLKDKAPIPSGWNEIKSWSLALDENLRFEFERYQPGALLLFGDKELQQEAANKPDMQLQLARKAFRQRLTSTPSVVATSDSYTGSSLFIKTYIFKQSDIIQDHFKQLRETWQTPDGLDIMEAPVFWMHARQFACGFYYKWKERPHVDWLIARKEWATFVRKAIINNRRGLDTEFQIAQAVVRGEYECPEYFIWKDIKDSFKPVTETIWLDKNLLLHCQGWLEKNQGILWTEHVAFGRELSLISGIAYYGQKGENEMGKAIEDASGPVIASIQANGVGRNLQKWDKNLIVSCPPSASVMEQLIGRTHRPGQESDEVSFEMPIKCIEDWNGLYQCIDQAKYVENTTQQKQKILFADMDLVDNSIIKSFMDGNNYCWKKN